MPQTRIPRSKLNPPPSPPSFPHDNHPTHESKAPNSKTHPSPTYLPTHVSNTNEKQPSVRTTITQTPSPATKYTCFHLSSCNHIPGSEILRLHSLTPTLPPYSHSLPPSLPLPPHKPLTEPEVGKFGGKVEPKLRKFEPKVPKFEPEVPKFEPRSTEI